MTAVAPDSAPTPAIGLSASAIQADCWERAEALRCRAQPGGVRYPSAGESAYLRRLADRLCDLARKLGRLHEAHIDVIEHRAMMLRAEYGELRSASDRALE